MCYDLIMTDFLGPLGGEVLRIGELNPGSSVKVFFRDDFQEPFEFEVDGQNTNQIKLKSPSGDNCEAIFSIRPLTGENVESEEGVIETGRGLVLEDVGTKAKREMACTYSAPVELCVIRPT